MGNANTDSKKRQILRRRLRKAGVPEHEIQRRVDAIAARDRATRGATFGPPPRGRQQHTQLTPEEQRLMQQRREREIEQERELEWKQARQQQRHMPTAEEETYARLNPDDSKFKPRRADPLLTGAARATGVAAKAATRGKTYAKWQLEEQDQL